MGALLKIFAKWSLVPVYISRLLGDGETPGQMMESVEDGIDYSAPSSLPVVNADGAGGKVDEPEVTHYQSQGSAGINEQGHPQNEVNNVGGVADGWERTFEGKAVPN